MLVIQFPSFSVGEGGVGEGALKKKSFVSQKKPVRPLMWQLVFFFVSSFLNHIHLKLVSNGNIS